MWVTARKPLTSFWWWFWILAPLRLTSIHTHVGPWLIAIHKANRYTEGWEKASHLYDSMVIPVKAPHHTHIHTLSCVQPPLLSIYKHPKSLTGLSACTTTGGEGKGRDRKQGLLWERIFERANSYSGWREEDKEKKEEKWVGGGFSVWKTRMETLHKETWVWLEGFRNNTFSHLLCVFPNEHRHPVGYTTQSLHLQMCFRQNNMFLTYFDVNKFSLCICFSVLLSSMMQHGEPWCKSVWKTAQLGEIPVHFKSWMEGVGLCTFSHTHIPTHTHKAVCWRGLTQAWISTERIPVYKHYGANLALETFLIAEHPGTIGGWT